MPINRSLPLPSSLTSKSPHGVTTILSGILSIFLLSDSKNNSNSPSEVPLDLLYFHTCPNLLFPPVVLVK